MRLELVYHIDLDRVHAMLQGHEVGQPVTEVYQVEVLLKQGIAFGPDLMYGVYIGLYRRADKVKTEHIARVLIVSAEE